MSRSQQVELDGGQHKNHREDEDDQDDVDQGHGDSIDMSWPCVGCRGVGDGTERRQEVPVGHDEVEEGVAVGTS